MKRLVRIFFMLFFVMGISALPVAAQTWNVGAASNSGGAGSVTATFNNGTLTIHGTGAMDDFGSSTIYWDGVAPPWHRLRITQLIIVGGVTSIGHNAFWDQINITSVTIPSSVASIGARAFIGCTDLTSVTIPSSVTSIGGGAFYGSGLTSVTIPNSVTSIGDMAFFGCTRLTSINVATDNSNYSSIGGVLFNKNQTTLITYPIGKHGSYTIPNSVTSIGNAAFSGCTGLTSVTIGNNVTSIGGSAFDGCTGLTSVTIGNNVTSIGGSAFDGCTGLTSVTIGNNVTSIGNAAFARCTRLTSITIPNSVTFIGSSAFTGCTGLTSINVLQNNSNYSSSTDGVLFNKNQTTLVIYPNGKHGSYTIPNSVTSIGNAAFSGCTGLTSVTIPSSVTSIGDMAFSACTRLKSISIINPIPPAIHQYTFANEHRDAARLDVPEGSLNLYKESHFWKEFVWINTPPTWEWNCGPASNPGAVTAALKEGTLTISGTGAMRDYTNDIDQRIAFPPWDNHKSSITNIVILNGVTTVGNSAFENCTDLISVTIPTSVTFIGRYAFYRCIGLASVTIPNNVTSIGSFAFYGCTSLTSVTIPNSVTTIGNQAFWGCNSLTSVTISANVISIGGAAFSNSTSLTSINVATNNANYSSENGILFNRSKSTLVQYPAGKQGAYSIPVSVTTIEPFAFWGCTGLTSVTIPASVATIGFNAFMDCNGLTSINVATNNANYSSEDDVLFNKNKTILIKYPADKQGSYSIPTSVTSIESNAFFDSKGLTSVTIPNGVTSIGSFAFHGCTSLKSITSLNSTPPQIASNTFSSVIKTTICLYVPQGSINLYNSDNNWKDFSCIRSTLELFTITFNSQGGSAISSQTVGNSDKVTKPTDPTRTNYTFGGWYREEAYTNPWNFDVDIVTSSITLYAKWILNWNGTADVSWYDAEQTKFTITTAAQLAGLAQLVNNGTDTFDGKTIILGNNIALNDTANWEEWGKGNLLERYYPDNVWRPIGSYSTTTTRPFAGTFDGAGFVICGVYTTGEGGSRPSYRGLFGYVRDGTIKNLLVTTSLIDECGSNSGGLVGYNSGGIIINSSFKGIVLAGNTIQYVGGLVGYNHLGSITNSNATGYVSGSSYVGGLVGYNNHGSITNSYATGNVDVNGDNSSHGNYGGGLVGINDAGKITNSYATGNVSHTGSFGGNYIGGLVGSNETQFAMITNSYATGDVTGRSDVGGLVGRSTNPRTITNSYYVSKTANAGIYTDRFGIPKTMGEMQSQEFVSLLNTGAFVLSANNANQWYNSNGQYPMLSNAMMTEADYLPAIAGCFENGDGTQNNPYIIKTKGHLENLSILGDMDISFEGEYIKLDNNIALNDITNWQNWANSAPDNSWRPIGSGVPFRGTFDGAGFVISGVYVYGDLNAIGLFGRVGSNGAIKNLGVTASYISYSGNNMVSRVGVLVGGNDGTITNSYTTGNVYSNTGYVGVLVGRNDGVITNSYVAGNITGSPRCFGVLVGFNSGTITNSYTTGTVTGTCTFYSGGLVASNNNGTITNSYYNSEIAGTGKLGIPKTATELKMQGTYLGWDFANIWAIRSEINDGYPYLRAFKADYDMSGVTFASQTVTYNGEAHSITATNIPSGVDVTYEGNGKTNVGVYIVAANFTTSNINYNAPAPSFTVEYSGFIDGETKDDLDGTLAFICGYTTSSNAGTVHDITPNGLTSDNYAITFTKGTLTVERAQIAVPTAIPDLVYSGSEQTGVLAGTGYTLFGNIATNADNHTAIATLDGNHKWSNGDTDNKNINWTIGKKALTNATVTVDETYIYTGSAITPNVTVTLSGYDPTYDISATNNINAGTATATITGTGNFTGTLTRNFTIQRKPLTAAMLSIPAVIYNGISRTPVLTVTDGTETLMMSTDYTVTLTPRTNAGTYPVSVTGAGNYTGTSSVNFIINPKLLTEEMLYIPAVVFDGTQKTPVLTVTDHDISALTRNADFTVTLTPRTDAGTYPVMVTGINNYTGTPSVNFVINSTQSCAHDFSVSVTDIPATCTNNGSGHYKCSLCGATGASFNISATGHNFGALTTTTSATCTINGEQARTCSVCGVKTDIAVIDMLGHNLTWAITTSPTCTHTGVNTGTCTRVSCTHTETDVIAIDLTNHDWGTWVVTLEPTKTSEGSRTRTCKHNVSHTQTEAIPVIPSWTVTVSGGVGGGNYAVGDIVTITADEAPLGKQFMLWTTDNNDLFFDRYERTTWFVMPAGDVTVTAVYDSGPLGTASSDRIIPVPQPDADAVSVSAFTSEFTAGPNPVSKQSGEVNFFWRGKRIQNAALTVFDASGNVVNKIKIKDTKDANDNNARRIVGFWDLKDAKGRLVGEGTYLVNGVVTTSDGKKERVSIMVGIR